MLAPLVGKHSNNIARFTTRRRVNEVNGIARHVRTLHSTRELRGEHGVTHPRLSGSIQFVRQPAGESQRAFTDRPHPLERNVTLSSVILREHAPHTQVGSLGNNVDGGMLLPVIKGDSTRPIVEIVITARSDGSQLLEELAS
jgi:hypothetical protein